MPARRARHVQDFAAQRQDRLRVAVARLLGRAAGAVAFDQENLRAARRIARAIGEFARQAQLARRRFAADFLFLFALEPVFGLIDHEIEQLVGFLRAFGQPVVEMIAHDIFDEPLRIRRRKLVFCLALEFRLANEDRQHRTGRCHQVVRA